MPNSEEKRLLALLRKIPLLAETPAEALQRLLQGAKLATFRPRQVVYLPGDRAEGVHFLTAGRIKISKVTRDGKELTIGYRVGGDIFGETCLIDGGPREEMAESMESSTTVEVERALVDRLIATNGGVAYRLARAFIARRRDLETMMERLVFKDVGAKLAELLLRLASEYGVQDQRGVLVSLKITHQEMANLIGSTRETVSLTLSQFKRKGLIQTEGRRVILSDREALRAIA
jgi:CRP/FNR family transcriptional regulator, cyclic AMP receptor protein